MLESSHSIAALFSSMFSVSQSTSAIRNPGTLRFFCNIQCHSSSEQSEYSNPTPLITNHLVSQFFSDHGHSNTVLHKVSHSALPHPVTVRGSEASIPIAVSGFPLSPPPHQYAASYLSIVPESDPHHYYHSIYSQDKVDYSTLLHGHY